MPDQQFVGLFLLLAGLIVGLGAVTVIDLLGFLGRKSSYWTESTIRTHKVTKPLIWLGLTLTLIGGGLFYASAGFSSFFGWQVAILAVLILNGCFLSFSISPRLIQQEKEGRSAELLPKAMQQQIILSFLISFTGWWSTVGLTAWYLSSKF